jgi:hypothetical protein
MSALVAAAQSDNVAELRRLLEEGALVSEQDANGHTPVVKFLIKEGGADINVVRTPDNTKHTVLQRVLIYGNYVLAQWLIEEGALIPTDIWRNFAGVYRLEHDDVAVLSSLLKILILLPMSPDQDHFLPEFVAKLSPQHAELCTRGRQLRDRLPAYLEQQRATVDTHCPLPTVLQAMVTAYALPTPEDLWSDGLQGL